MSLLKLLTFIWTFYGLIACLDAVTCSKGHGQVNRQCVPCAEGFFQTEENYPFRCKPCRKCNQKSGSVVIKTCTADTNRECQCPKGFVPLESDSVTCSCVVGHGLLSGECVECKDGYFSDKRNSPCQKWRECKSGVEVNGTKTKDAICKDPEITTAPASNNSPSFVTRLTSTRPHEGTQTTTVPQHTTTTTAVPKTTVSTGNHIGLALIILGIVGLLILTALTCKLRISTCVQRKPEPRDSLCRKPVEESGDSSRTSLKQNPEEP